MDEIDEQKDNLDEMLNALTRKERAFCFEYIKHFNGAKAARDAGYSERSDDEIAHENLRKPKIAKVIDILCETRIMSENEGMIKLTEWGRGSFEPFLTVDGMVDLTRSEARQNIGLIKKIKQTKRVIADKEDDSDIVAELVTTEIELHDPKDAVKSILEAKGRLSKRIELTGKNGEPLQTVTIFQLPDNGRDTGNT